MRATIALLERSLERDVGAPLWEPAPAGDWSYRPATGYPLSLKLTRRPWLARIVLRLLWRPASLRYARRSSGHTDTGPL